MSLSNVRLAAAVNSSLRPRSSPRPLSAKQTKYHILQGVFWSTFGILGVTAETQYHHRLCNESTAKSKLSVDPVTRIALLA